MIRCYLEHEFVSIGSIQEMARRDGIYLSEVEIRKELDLDLGVQLKGNQARLLPPGTEEAVRALLFEISKPPTAADWWAAKKKAHR